MRDFITLNPTFIRLQVTYYGEGRVHNHSRVCSSDPDFLNISLGPNFKLSLGKADIISLIEGEHTKCASTGTCGEIKFPEAAAASC